MRKNYFFTFLVIFIGIHLKSQELNITVKVDPVAADYEEILNQKYDYKCDTVSFNKTIAPLRNSPDPGYHVIYNLLKAEGQANCFDRVTGNSNVLYEAALQQAKEIGPEFEIVANIHYAKYLYHYRNMEKALPYFLQADHLLEKYPSKEHIRPQESYRWIGYYFGTIGDEALSISALEKAKSLSKNRNGHYASLLDALGMHYYNRGDIKKAEQYFIQSQGIAKAAKDEVRYAKALGNIALIYAKRGKTDLAKELIIKDIEISERKHEDQNTMYAYTLLAEVHMQDNNFLEAEKALAKASAIAVTKPYFAINEIKIEKLRTQVYKFLNKREEELNSFKRITELENRLKSMDGEFALSNANLLMQKSKLQAAHKEAQYQKERSALTRTIYLVLLFLALVLLTAVYANSRKALRNRELKYKQKVLVMEMEKMLVEQKLSETQENLDAQVEYLKNKNFQINRLKGEIQNIKHSKSYYLEEEQGHLSALLESHLMTDENWGNFKREFIKVYPDFYRTLQTEFHDLTDANYRIILLKKLGFNNTEISQLLGITVDAIKKSNQRMKKKLGDRYSELSEIIQRP